METSYKNGEELTRDEAERLAHSIVEEALDHPVIYPDDDWIGVGCNWDLNLHTEDGTFCAELYPVDRNGNTMTGSWINIL